MRRKQEHKVLFINDILLFVLMLHMEPRLRSGSTIFAEVPASVFIEIK